MGKDSRRADGGGRTAINRERHEGGGEERNGFRGLRGCGGWREEAGRMRGKACKMRGEAARLGAGGREQGG